MTKKDRENWQKRKDFESVDIDLKPWDGLNVEHQNTLKHEFVKFCLTAAIHNNDREWDSEVRFGNGREADIVDLGPPDGLPVVYEVETGVTDARKQEKLDHFYIEGVTRDVIVIDPDDVPDEPEEATAYLSAQVVIG